MLVEAFEKLPNYFGGAHVGVKFVFTSEGGDAAALQNRVRVKGAYQQHSCSCLASNICTCWISAAV